MPFGIDDVGMAMAAGGGASSAGGFSSLFGGSGGLLGGAISALGSLFGGEETNKANAEMAQKQMDFQERMSSTAYQRATKDMMAAGLNPMLAYSQGGASTPGGAMAQMQNALGNAVSSGQQGAQIGPQLEQVKALTDQARAQTEKIGADTDVSRSQVLLNAAMAGKAQQDMKTGTSTAAQLDASVARMLRENELDIPYWNVARQMHETNLASQRTALTGAEADSARQAAGAGFGRAQAQEMFARARHHAASATLGELGFSRGAAESGMYREHPNMIYADPAFKAVNSAANVSRLFGR